MSVGSGPQLEAELLDIAWILAIEHGFYIGVLCGCSGPEFMLQWYSQLVNNEPPIATSHTPSALKSS